MENLQSSKEKKVGNSTIEYLQTDLDHLTDEFQEKRIIVAGEMHGVQQNYDIYRFMVEEMDIEAVGLEIPDQHFSFLKRLNEGDLKNPLVNFKLKNKLYKDGRFSKSLLSFLFFLRDSNVKVFFFDNAKYERDKSGEENEVIRDRTMASEILKSVGNNTSLIIAGEHHTKINRNSSMANFLSQSTDFVRANLEYNSGEYYNFGQRDFEQGEQVLSSNIEFKNNCDESQFDFTVPKASKVDLF